MIRHGVRKLSSAVAALVPALLVASALAFAGCGEAPPQTIDTVQINLDFGGGVSLTSVNYTLNGPNGFLRTGTLAVGASDLISGTFQNLPAGSFTVSVVGSASNDVDYCQGTATFSIASMMNASVQIPLTCTGLAAVTANVDNCPILDSLSAFPAEVFVGGSISLVAAAHDPDAVPGPIVPTWSASSGTLGNQSATGATFTCTTAGPATIHLSITDGTPGGICADSASVTVMCTQPTAALVGSRRARRTV